VNCCLGVNHKFRSNVIAITMVLKPKICDSLVELPIWVNLNEDSSLGASVERKLGLRNFPGQTPSPKLTGRHLTGYSVGRDEQWASSTSATMLTPYSTMSTPLRPDRPVFGA
jgi:hypothetical protein